MRKLLYILAGAYEPPKAAKEHVTTVYIQVPSKYKFERATVSILGSARLLELLELYVTQ